MNGHVLQGHYEAILLCERFLGPYAWIARNSGSGQTVDRSARGGEAIRRGWLIKPYVPQSACRCSGWSPAPGGLRQPPRGRPNGIRSHPRWNLPIGGVFFPNFAVTSNQVGVTTGRWNGGLCGEELDRQEDWGTVRPGWASGWRVRCAPCRRGSFASFVRARRRKRGRRTGCGIRPDRSRGRRVRRRPRQCRG